MAGTVLMVLTVVLIVNENISYATRSTKNEISADVYNDRGQ